MRAVVWHGIGDIRMDSVPEPSLIDPTDAIVKITRSAICGTDLHMVRGTFAGMTEGTILGHEAVGVVTEVGAAVRGFKPGDRVLVCSTISCGVCAQCRRGNTAQCDKANSNGPQAGTAFFGGTAATGPINGLQAEYARIPWAAHTLIALPDQITDDQAILLSDIFPTSWFGVELAGVRRGDTVAVFGAGIVGQFAIAAAFLQGAGRVLAIDGNETRLATALTQNAEIINFNRDDPLEVIRDLTLGTGVDAVIDAVGVDAQSPKSGPATPAAEASAQFAEQVAQVAPDADPDGSLWVPGDAPGQVLDWAVEAVAKAGRIGIIGVYPPTFTSFPTGTAMNKNLTMRMGNCNHRSITPQLLNVVVSGQFDPTRFITQHEEIVGSIDAYESFDRRDAGWLKTVLEVS